MKWILAILSVLLLLAGCGTLGFDSSPGPENIIRENGKILIVDRTGKQWDVTRAEQFYGLKADKFQFGLGPDAIRPILNPEYLKPGEPGYPASNESFLVIGSDLNDIVRAYPIGILSSYEIANEHFDSTFVAVGY